MALFLVQRQRKGAIDFAKAVRQCGFQEAVELLSAIVPSESSKHPSKTPDHTEQEQLKPYTGKYEKFKVECEWLDKRIPDKAVLERYGVFAYNNPARKSAYSGRVLIPFKSHIEGTIFGYLGRDIHEDTQVKYLIPSGFPKSRFLFGAHELCTSSPLPLRRVYLVESPFCVMKFAMYELPAVSCFGWHCSPEQLQLLTGLCKGVVFLPDRNKKAESSQVLPAIAEKLWLRFPELPAGVDDPEQLSRESILAL